MEKDGSELKPLTSVAPFTTAGLATSVVTRSWLPVVAEIDWPGDRVTDSTEMMFAGPWD